MSHVMCIKGEEESTDKRGLSCINLKVNNNNKSHNHITRRRSFNCIGLSKGEANFLFIQYVFNLFSASSHFYFVCKEEKKSLKSCLMYH